MTLAIEQAMSAKNIELLDWMSPANKIQGQGKAQDRHEQDRLSRQCGAIIQSL